MTYWHRKEYVILTMDATHKLIGLMPKKGWYKGKRPVYVVGSKKKPPKKRSREKRSREKRKKGITLLGAIGSRGEYYFRFYDAGNWDNTKNFLHGVHKKFGKALIFLDNATYHKKAGLESLTRETNGDLQFEFFLKYTPELNPIETQWSGIKKKVAGLVTANSKEFKVMVHRGIRNKTIPIVKLHDYLIP